MIDKRYILFTRIPIARNVSGLYFCDPLWAKDISLHLKYINNFGLCCPVVRQNDTSGLVNISEFNIKYFYELKKDYGLASVIYNLIPNFIRVAKATKSAKIVHSSGAGWAFPLSFYLLIIRPFFAFQWIMVIESSVWMLEKHEKATLRKILVHYFHRYFITRCLKKANARIFTQSFYRHFFLGDEESRTLINPATWVDEKVLLSAEAVKQRYLNKQEEITRFIFPARLIADKGVYTLFNAIEILKKMDIALSVTIIGSGKLAEICKNFALNNVGSIEVTYLDAIDYDQKFFSIISAHDFVLVPNLKQEQPRIIFDAFSQGVAVIASDTSGILDITNSENSIIFKTGDPQSFAQAIYSAAKGLNNALSMGINSLGYAKGKTHLKMHEDRQQFLEQILNINHPDNEL